MQKRDSKGRFTKQSGVVHGFKGFAPGMVCRDQHYQEGKTYVIEGSPVLCGQGFHFCENPFDVLSFYPLVDSEGFLNEFAEVTATGECKSDGIKTVTNELKIGAKLGIPGFCKAAFEYIHNSCTESPAGGDNSRQAQSGYGSRQAQSGYRSQQAQSGANSRQTQSGYGSQQTQSGYGSQQAQSGDNSRQAQSGDNSRQAQSGYGSRQTQSGYGSRQTQSGYGSRQASVGGRSTACAENEDCLVAILGPEGRVRGKLGCVLVLADYRAGRGGLDVIDRVVSVKVDGKKIKEDTWYVLEKGEFKEAL